MSTQPARGIFRGSKWKGLRNIENLFIFGDSYSSIEEDDNFLPHPTAANPLGCDSPYPGDPWTDEGGPNWVAHLLTDFTAAYGDGLRIYDYAKGGETVTGLAHQVRHKFLRRHCETVEWIPEDSLFVLWIGINDLAETATPVHPIKLLFQLIGELHSGGARNFVLIDCPPIHRTPGVDPEFGPSPDRFEDWNRLLFMQARFFVAKHQDYTNVQPEAGSTSSSSSSSRATSTPGASSPSPNTSPRSASRMSTGSSGGGSSISQSLTPYTTPVSTPSGVGVDGDVSMFVFSSWNTFMSILDYPEAYHFDSDDVDEAEGPIWMDNLHPTSKVHAIIAKHLFNFLNGIKASE
ncbi:hypothetical protein CPB86DRAFT_782701 [Serendipita vermifera]|nr:hypothetical protein CPB86DRAFT_782701 [Serendipita vermifera]